LPIYLDWLEQPNEQDLVDLDKLFADAPDDWESDNGEPLNARWALNRLSKERKLALGQFNDRIVASAWLTKQSEGPSQPYLFKVDKLCVRAITRKRGVAKQLMVRLCQWADQQQHHLLVDDQADNLSGLYELGFVQHGKGWLYMARSTVHS